MATNSEVKLVNTLPHDAELVGPTESRTYTRNPNNILRLDEKEAAMLPEAHGMPVMEPPEWASLAGTIPGPEVEGQHVDLLVSAFVGQYIKEHGFPSSWPKNYVRHVYAPNTSPAYVIRAENGSIKGTTRLVRYV